MKFFRYYDQKEVSSRKQLLKGIKVSLLLSLTSFRKTKLEEAQEKFSFNHVWTINGNIMFKNENDEPNIYYG